MTNLRLPGQYNERLLGSVGLQGPYYNWNRWYLPAEPSPHSDEPEHLPEDAVLCEIHDDWAVVRRYTTITRDEVEEEQRALKPAPKKHAA